MNAQRGFVITPLILLAIKAGALLLAVAAVVGAYRWHANGLREEGRAEVRAEWTTERTRQLEAARANDAEQRRIEQRRQSLQAEADERKTHAIHDLDQRLAAAVGELRNRPERPAAASGTGGDPPARQACTGAELYRPDAEFLVREAARAQRVLIERDDLWEKYNALTVKP